MNLQLPVANGKRYLLIALGFRKLVDGTSVALSRGMHQRHIPTPRLLLASSLLLLLAGTAACAENGKVCFPHPDDCSDDRVVTDPATVTFDMDARLSDGAKTTELARGGTTVLLARRSKVRFGVSVSSPSPGAQVTSLGGGGFLVSSGATEAVDLDVEGELDSGGLFVGVAVLPTTPTARVSLAPEPDYVLSGEAGAYHVEAPLTTVQLFDDADGRLADLSIELGAETSDGVTQPEWDQVSLPEAAGDYRVSVVAGSFGERSFDVAVVDDIDELSAEWTREPTETVAGSLCLHAFLGDLEVYAPAWSLTGDSVKRSGANCVELGATETVTADAFGLTLVVTGGDNQ